MIVRKYLSFHILLLGLTLAFVLVSCKPSVPSKYLSPGEMEDILYDYHLTMAMADNSSDRAVTQRVYLDAVYKKYGITEAEFDSSMVYYTRHIDRLHDIYENLSERLSDEALSLGASASDINIYGVQGTKGDTANIWPGSRAMVLSQQIPYNSSSFSFKADSAFHKGDRLNLEFDAQFLFQSGMRDGIAVIAVKFANDSVASQMLHVSNTQHYVLSVEDRDNLLIKEVRGFFLLGNGSAGDAKSPSMRLLVLQNIRLIRMHVKHDTPEPAKTPFGTADSSSGSQPVHDIPTDKAINRVSEQQGSLQPVH